MWNYIRARKVAVPSLYFAHVRPVLRRAGALLAHGTWTPAHEDESVEHALVRFRTVGDMTCTGAVRSTARTLDEVIAEVASARVTERSARADDQRAESAMEDRKRAGYF